MQHIRGKVFLQDKHLSEPVMQLCYGEPYACCTSHVATTAHDVEVDLKMCHFVLHDSCYTPGAFDTRNQKVHLRVPGLNCDYHSLRMAAETSWELARLPRLVCANLS